MKNQTKLSVLSFGAGIQSTALALMSGDPQFNIPLFDFAVFADTGAEPQSVYDCLDKIRTRVSYPVIVHMHKTGLLDAVTHPKAGGFGAIPAFVENQDGSIGMLRRQCTKEYKLNAIVEAVRRELGYEPRQKVMHSVDMYIGISRDEMQRMATPLTPWITNKYPLVDMQWRRGHCEDYLKKVWSHSVGKSACTFCPYRDNRGWREMKQSDPKSWDQACMVDDKIRSGFEKTTGKLFLHRSAKALRDVDFDELLARDDDQVEFGFLEECDGICGV